jgi:ribosomal protein L13
MDTDLYWFFGENCDLRDWVKVFASKELVFGTTRFVLKIIGYSHQIEITQNQITTTEIMASKIPLQIIEQAIKIKLQKGFEKESQSGAVKVEKYDHFKAKEFLKTPDCFAYLFDKDCWTAISWSIAKSEINFKTMHTYPELNLTVFSHSSYLL